MEYVEYDLGEVGDVGTQKKHFISQTLSSSQLVQLLKMVQLYHIYRHTSHILEFSTRFFNLDIFLTENTCRIVAYM